jgi:hypothetical protein
LRNPCSRVHVVGIGIFIVMTVTLAGSACGPLGSGEDGASTLDSTSAGTSGRLIDVDDVVKPVDDLLALAPERARCQQKHLFVFVGSSEDTGHWVQADANAAFVLEDMKRRAASLAMLEAEIGKATSGLERKLASEPTCGNGVRPSVVLLRVLDGDGAGNSRIETNSFNYITFQGNTRWFRAATKSWTYAPATGVTPAADGATFELDLPASIGAIAQAFAAADPKAIAAGTALPGSAPRAADQITYVFKAHGGRVAKAAIRPELDAILALTDEAAREQSEPISLMDGWGPGGARLESSVYSPYWQRDQTPTDPADPDTLREPGDPVLNDGVDRLLGDGGDPLLGAGKSVLFRSTVSPFSAVTPAAFAVHTKGHAVVYGDAAAAPGLTPLRLPASAAADATTLVIMDSCYGSQAALAALVGANTRAVMLANSHAMLYNLLDYAMLDLTQWLKAPDVLHRIASNPSSATAEEQRLMKSMGLGQYQAAAAGAAAPVMRLELFTQGQTAPAGGTH